MDRRQLLERTALLAIAGSLTGVAGCGADPKLARADVARTPPDTAAAPTVSAAASALGVDLLRATSGGNLICSPLSVLVALAMVRNGAGGTTAAEMDKALHLPQLDALNAGLNAVDQTLVTRSGARQNGDTKGTVEIDVANAVWGQQGITWRPQFLNTLSADYGTGVRETDFKRTAEAIEAVNRWVSDQTHGKITDIANPQVITAETVLALVNALYLKAPWENAFADAGDQPFAGPDGSAPVPMITDDVRSSFVKGRGWTAARLPLLGNEVAVTVVRPDGDLATLLGTLVDGGLARLLRQPPLGATSVTLPTFTFRSKLDLKPVLRKLGMSTAFTPDADFGGLSADAQLMLQAVAHQGFIALDQNGVEAAAATVVTVMPTSGLVHEHTLLLDRPFFFCIHDVELALPLLVGVVVDPTA